MHGVQVSSILSAPWKVRGFEYDHIVAPHITLLSSQLRTQLAQRGPCMSVLVGDGGYSNPSISDSGFSLTSEIQEPSIALLHIICQHPAVKRTSGKLRRCNGKHNTANYLSTSSCWYVLRSRCTDRTDTVTQDRWDYTRPESQDQEQWDASSKAWLALTLAQRQPYHERTFALGNLFPDAPGLPTEEQVTRIFQPHQTINERNLSVLSGADRTIWLRTCYAPELDAVYQEMAQGVAGFIVDANAFLDDVNLYDFEDSWDKVLLRLPALCDRDKWQTLDEDPNPWIHDEDWLPETHPGFDLYEAGYREVVMMYLLDRQALQEKLITILWLDTFGECVWWYRISADGDTLQSLTGHLFATNGLMEMAETAGEGEEERENSVYAKGSLMDWIN
jgi:hypothetical protein